MRKLNSVDILNKDIIRRYDIDPDFFGWDEIDVYTQDFL
jgi:hypothetical protein